jgi:hypothetical protein
MVRVWPAICIRGERKIPWHHIYQIGDRRQDFHRKGKMFGGTRSRKLLRESHASVDEFGNILEIHWLQLDLQKKGPELCPA